MTKTTDFWVGDRFVRPALGEIQLGLERVHLEPRSMQVLLALVDKAPEVVPKQELIDAVWGDDFVTDDVLTHAIWDLRRAFGDSAADPEFIQTIPKRGYRLIAPVKPLEQPRRRASDRGRAAGPRPRSVRRPRLLLLAVLGLISLALLTWAALRFGNGGPRDPRPVSQPASLRVLLTVGYPDGPKGWGERLQAGLERGLAGSGVELIPADSCAAGGGAEIDYCLEAELLHPVGGYAARIRLLRGDGGLAYSASAPISEGGLNLEAAAGDLASKVRTLFEVFADPFYDDPDAQPWFSLQEHDVRAVRDYLLGLAYVYRNEPGGGPAMQSAIRRAPDFVAPRIFLTPTLVLEGDAAALADQRRELERLYPNANAFEKAMIQWAIALIDHDPAEQIQQLKIALSKVGSNRPIEYVLGFTLAEQGDLEEAWRYIEPLLGYNWHYPGLYSAAAEIAILRERIGDIRKALDLALNVEPVDPEVLAVMTALAIYDEDAAREERFRKRLELRRRALTGEHLYRFELPAVAETLAARAESEGRAVVAARLRESAG